MREEILAMNERMSALFIETTPQRREYRRQHPTEFYKTLCMDGRVNLRRCCKIPFGLTTPYRNIGGRFSAGWPKFRDSLLEGYEYAHSMHVLACLLETYHFSESGKDLGCAGFGHNLEDAMEYLEGFLNEIKRAFPKMIWPFLLGIETDSDALILHLEDGSKIDMRQVTNPTQSYFERILTQRCRSYPDQILMDIIPFLMGNIEHQEDLKRQGGRPTKAKRHNERCLGLGQGFDWNDKDNFMLILGPCDPALDKAIVRAAEIIENNLRGEDGEVDEEERSKGGILLVSTPFRGRKLWQRPSAVEQSRYLTRLALDSIQNNLPSMAGYFVPLVGVLDQDTRRFEEIK